MYHTNIVIFLIFIENILVDTFLFYEENCKPPTVKYDAYKNQLFMQDPISKWSLLNLDTINQHPSDSFKEAVLIIPKFLNIFIMVKEYLTSYIQSEGTIVY